MNFEIEVRLIEVLRTTHAVFQQVKLILPCLVKDCVSSHQMSQLHRFTNVLRNDKQLDMFWGAMSFSCEKINTQ